MVSFFIIIIIVLVLVLFVLPYYCAVHDIDLDSEVKLKGKQKESVQEESMQKVLQRAKDMEQIMLFAKNNGVDLGELKKKRDNLYQIAVRNCATAEFTIPSTPDTVTAKYSGTIAEYYAEQINKERRQEYNTSLKRSNNIADEGWKCRMECEKVEREILNKLRQIPNSDEYCEMLGRCFDEDKSILDEAQVALVKASFKI